MFRNRKLKIPRTRSGQSTVEYIVLVTAVIGAIILFFLDQNQGFKKQMNLTYTTLTENIENGATTLTGKQLGGVPNAGSTIITVNAFKNPFGT